ncbi:MAG: cation-translocating P-type ATPase, partial [Candidatus Geothermincolales bacterium]
LRRYGHNRFREERPAHPLVLLLRQFQDFMIYVLITAALVSGLLLNELVDAVVILAIVVANAILGFVQEFRAEKAILALKELSAPTAQVLREGKVMEVPSKDLVPGDIILLEAGDRVPADARLVESHSLKAEEASLTGESGSVDKNTEPLEDPMSPIGDRRNMVYAGTHVVHGRGKAIVTATGRRSQLGQIAEMIGEAEEERTPLQQELASTGKRIAMICLGTCAVIFGLGVIRHQEWSQMFLFSVSLAVAAIPEGLPAIVTISLALGVRRMARENALIRRLPAVETLGCAQVICTDKTGTLTLNEMELREIRVPGHAPLKNPLDLRDMEGRLRNSVEILLSSACLCNDTRFQDGSYIGEGTEVALLKAAEKLSFPVAEIREAMPRRGEIPFESERKMMSTLHPADPTLLQRLPVDTPYILVSKGAPEAILERCGSLFDGNRIVPMDERTAEGLLKEAEELALQALRPLAFAVKPLEAIAGGSSLEEEEKQGLVYLGMVGMMDPPRPEVYRALELCRKAGIEVVMITGDHPTTAMAIARELAILSGDKELVTGSELAAMADEELEERVERIAVYARVSPADKVKIVRAWKAKGKVVAMTGDGVNDAPALKNADIGIAMGITGTDVSKEAADMVLADDNFASIVNAVREGRIIYDNIKKSIFFLLSCNVSSVIVLFLGTLVSSRLPMRPIQILWMNLMTNGLPALALGVDTAAPDIMNRPPRDPQEGILTLGMQLKLFLQGAILSLGGLTAFFASQYVMFPGQIERFQTITFSVLVFSQLLHAYNCRSATRSFTELPLFDNKALLYALFCSATLQFSVLFLPPLKSVFGTASIGMPGWGLVTSCVILPVVLIDRWKVLARNRNRGRAES